MGRMLEALQKVGSAQEAAESVRPLTSEELAVFGVSRPTAVEEPPVVEASPKPEMPPSPPPVAAVASPPSEANAAPPAPVVAETPLPRPEAAEPVDAYEAQLRRNASERRWADLAATVSTTNAREPEAVEPREVRPRQDRPSSAVGQGRQQQCQEVADRLLAQLPLGRSAVVLFSRASEAEEDAALLADLAVTLARRSSGELLVVDVDFGRPRLGPYFGVEAEVGLAHVLQGRVDWREVVRRTKTARLSLLPAGYGLGTALPEAALLGAWLDELRSHYDLVLLVAAAARSPEVGRWAGLCDASYLTIGLGRVTRRQLRQAAALLERSGASLQGAIVLE